jgi:hypothetical protein
MRQAKRVLAQSSVVLTSYEQLRAELENANDKVARRDEEDAGQ